MFSDLRFAEDRLFQGAEPGRIYDSQATAAYKSPLYEMTQATPTCLWNDSASIQELTYSIEHGAVGATCNPVIVLGVLKKEMNFWKDRIREIIDEWPRPRKIRSRGNLFARFP